MSKNQSPLPDPQTAYNNLFQGVRARVFFQKCAAAGWEPRTMAEAETMLNTAAKLREFDLTQTQPTKAAADSPFVAMNQDLDRALQAHGFAPAQQDVDFSYKQAADALAQDPTLYNSVLALRADEAHQIEREFAGRQVA